MLLAAIILHLNSLQVNIRCMPFSFHFQTQLMPLAVPHHTQNFYALATDSLIINLCLCTLCRLFLKWPLSFFSLRMSNLSFKIKLRLTFCRIPSPTIMFWWPYGSRNCSGLPIAIVSFFPLAIQLKDVSRGHMTSFCPMGFEENFHEQLLDLILKGLLFDLYFLFFPSCKLEHGRSTLRNDKVTR